MDRIATRSRYGWRAQLVWSAPLVVLLVAIAATWIARAEILAETTRIDTLKVDNTTTVGSGITADNGLRVFDAVVSPLVGSNNTISCPTCGSGGGISGLTSPFLPVANGSSTIINSSIQDNGTTVSVGDAKEIHGGGAQFSAGTDVTYNFSAGATPTTYEVIVPTGTATGNEVIPLAILPFSFNYDTTLQPSDYWGVDSEFTINHSAGSNALTVAAYQCNTKLTNPIAGDANYCILGATGGGIARVPDGGNFGGTTISSTGGILSTSATQNFSSAATFEIGNNNLFAPNWQIEFAGSAGANPEIGIGMGVPTDGTQLATKNTLAGNTTSGIGVELDTTLNAGARGGYFISRAAGGGTPASNTSAGFINVGSTAGFCGGATANDACVFSDFGALDISIGSGSAGTTIERMTQTVAGNTLVTFPGATTHLSTVGATAPILSSCGTGSPTVVGSDIAGRFTTGAGATTCTLTFGLTYGNTPACIVEAEGTATEPTYTLSATAITMSVDIASTTYDYHCWKIQ